MKSGFHALLIFSLRNNSYTLSLCWLKWGFPIQYILLLTQVGKELIIPCDIHFNFGYWIFSMNLRTIFLRLDFHFLFFYFMRTIVT